MFLCMSDGGIRFVAGSGNGIEVANEKVLEKSSEIDLILRRFT